jgi:hypothetical protein
MSDLGSAILEALDRQATAARRLDSAPRLDELLARAEYEVDDPEHLGGTWERLSPRARGRRIRRMRAILNALGKQSADAPIVAAIVRGRQ